jgi:hypothetical protein
MSDEVKASAIWNGLKVDTYTNVRTGEMKLYQPKRLIPVLLARSTPANGKTEWTYDGNGANFRDIYNDQQRAIGGKELSQKDFNQRFFTQGTNSFNKIRGTILRTEKNYIDAGIPITERETVKKGHFDNRVPGSVDPASDIMVNSDGTIPDRKNSGEQLIQRDPRLPTNQVSKDKDGSLSGGESGDTLDYGGNNFKVDTNTKTVGGKSELLRYPLKSPPPGLNYDYIKIRAYEYQPTGVGLKKENISDSPGGTAYETIILPMQPNIEDTNSVNWSTDTLSPIQAALGEFAGKTIGALGNLSGQEMLGALKGLGGDLKMAMESPAVKSFITSYFAGQAVGANLVGRSQGMVINPNLELLFNGPTLRTFNFSFPMSPRNDKEAEQIRKIIRAFKRNSAVQRSNDGLFLKSPRVFKIEYIYNGGVTKNENDEEVAATGGQHPYLNKIRLCALTSFKVNYTPDNTYMTFHENGSLTSYNISMSFNELNPIYADQYPDNEENMGF